MQHSVLVQERAVSADGLTSFDLAVNPLSVLLIALRPLNDTGTLSNFGTYLNLINAINRLNIFYRGGHVQSMSGQDIAALNYYRWGIMPQQPNHADTNNERRCAVLPVLLGRRAYDPLSCFPASRRGELVLELDLDIADTGYDGLRISVEGVELFGARPVEFERRVQNAVTFSSTGDNDVHLPIGNFMRGILAFGTTGFTGATPAPTLGRLSLLVDNVATRYQSTDFEVAMTINSLLGRQPPALDEHIHRVDATSASTSEATTLAHLVGSGGWKNYCYLDLDPTRNDVWSINTAGRSSVVLRSNAEAAEAVRAIAIERVAL